MTYRGQIQKGQVVLDEPASLPDGTVVKVEVDEQPLETVQPERSIWDDLRELAGTVEGLPPDFAEEHDHYIHGTPKRKRR